MSGMRRYAEGVELVEQVPSDDQAALGISKGLDVGVCLALELDCHLRKEGLLRFEIQ